MKKLVTAIALAALCFCSTAQAREISTEDMKQIMQDTSCLLVEVEETKKSLAIERQETDKYIELSKELEKENAKIKKASQEKRIGAIALGALIGLGIGALVSR